MSYYSPSYTIPSDNGIPSQISASPYNHFTSGNYVTPFRRTQPSCCPSSTPFPTQHHTGYGDNPYYAPPPPLASPVVPSCPYQHHHRQTSYGYHSPPHYDHHGAVHPVVLPTSGAISYANAPTVVPAMASVPSAHYGAPVYLSSVGNRGYYQTSGMDQTPFVVASSSSSCSDRRCKHHRHHRSSRHSGHSSSSRSSSRSSSPDISSSHGHRSRRSSRGLLTYLPSL